ncbi:unnamed protein product [Caenorhabditis auriculariae]|uniref:Uncharacterized protein n=1 Tax=Caenorhabditis auriculariae TaxID=2777116 RepID=A0A8S1HC67_9PELO|nr:unnamed protein product [Caenorhabditis auriculariae]
MHFTWLFILSAISLSKLVRTQLQDSFFANKDQTSPLLSQMQFANFETPRDPLPEVDAHRIIGPIISPFMDMFDQMQENARAKAYAEKIRKDREDHPLSTSRSLLEMIQRLQQPSTTTTPQPPFIERILKPYIEPWQKQLDDFSKDVAGITLIPTSSTTTAAPTTTTTASIIEKRQPQRQLLALRGSSIRICSIGSSSTETKEMLRYLNERNVKQHSLEWEKPILGLANPFTLNPYMQMFTTPKPIELSTLPKIPDRYVHDPNALPPINPQFKLQDPFYNPLFPNRKSKFFDLLAGGEAARVLG